MSTHKTTIALAAICASFVGSPAVRDTAAQEVAGELSLQRVMLSAGGVGYFEYEAEVEGDAVLELSVRLEQVDDVLKSIVVYDDRGVAGAISLPGRQPLADAFRDLPFGPQAFVSPVALLNALPGARVRATGSRRVEGRLVRVVPEQVLLENRAGSVTRHRVSLLTAQGLQTFLLEDADAVEFVDAQVEGQVESALAAMLAHRTRDRRTLAVVSNGEGKRTIRLGYVVATSLWKASYRLALGNVGSSTARLQGWAVLENMSGVDWEDIELTLASGNPVTFRQALYEAYYVDRPEVPVEVLGRVLPVPDSGSVRLEAPAAPPATPVTRALAGQRETMMMRGRPSRAEAPEGASLASQDSAVPALAAPPSEARILAAASTQAATSVSFRIPYPVSVRSGGSLLVPVIDRQLPAQRISLYQPTTHSRHPLAAIRLSNDGNTDLPPGVLTLYARAENGSAFVGDAQLSPLPAGDQRLISYALDQRTVVDREISSAQTLSNGRIADGVLTLTYAQEQVTRYRLKAPAGEARSLLIEQPRMPGWKLEQPSPERVEATETQYRMQASLEAGESGQLEAVMTRPLAQTVALIELGGEQYAHYSKTGELDPEIREAFAELAKLRAVVDRYQRQLQELDRAREDIHREQQRIRNNLSRVPGNSDLHKRYLRKLDAQEGSLETMQRDASAARGQLEKANAALAEFVRGLKI